MNENFNFNTTPTTNKPSAKRYSTLVIFCILIIILLAYMHIVKNGLHVEITVPKEINIPQEIVKEVKANFVSTTTKSDETIKIVTQSATMENVYYYGKIIIGAAVIIGALYLYYKYDTSFPDLSKSIPPNTPASSLQPLQPEIVGGLQQPPTTIVANEQ